MFVGIALVALVVFGLFATAGENGPEAAVARRTGAALLALGVFASAFFATGVTASAAIVATVDLGTASADAVLAGSTVTNTGATTLDGSLGLSPGTAVTGFPPGLVLAPGTTNIYPDPVAQQAQIDLTAAYTDAAARTIDATTTADLVGLNLQSGVYAGPAKSPLSLTGALTLDGAGDPTSVFIFQTDSTLSTSAGSTINLINGAQACNVFWQVGSSATLNTGSQFTGNILALTSITVTSGVTVNGRALARNGAVTLDNDTFTEPTCDLTPPTTTTTTTTAAPTTTSPRPRPQPQRQPPPRAPRPRAPRPPQQQPHPPPRAPRPRQQQPEPPRAPGPRRLCRAPPPQPRRTMLPPPPPPPLPTTRPRCRSPDNPPRPCSSSHWSRSGWGQALSPSSESGRTPSHWALK